MSEHRLERLGRLIQEKIGTLIVEGKIKDPRVDTFLSVSRVRLSRDLGYADVYVSSYKSAEGLEKGVAGLQSAAGFIQAQLNGQMHIRQTPRLRFHADDGMRDGFEMIKKIDELTKDAESSPSGDSAGG
ncbi:30S ribosome-binding factor RbfA [Treponema sp. OttesenSCG-928-L16]|nr:30S ribosome-binding factor RbfA [Treponema sp. OttesenSCG-928-L16]